MREAKDGGTTATMAALIKAADLAAATHTEAVASVMVVDIKETEEEEVAVALKAEAAEA
jgi:hypothetical protein